MRLHLVIQRHGLPVTRILWSTSSPSLEQTASYRPSANSSAIASTRAPNALFANSGYTIAQLLEDVNEVVPLETEPRLFGDRSTGQWGLEDYVVEVAGSECLHFMDVGGLLRDGDEVVIRALQISDLRARRLSGRHQTSVDGKHLIDGVPFGRPYLKRSTSSRPAINIPPRKKRRTVYGIGGGYEEEDTEWAPVDYEATGKELSQLPDQHGDYNEADDEDFYEDYHEGEDSEDDNEDDETGDGDETVIRHPVEERVEGKPEDAQVSESDFEHEAEAEDLTQELQELKEDMQMSGLDLLGVYDEQASRLRSTKSPTVQGSPSLKSPFLRSPGGRQVSKSVRFESGRQVQQQESPASHKVKSPVSAKQPSSAKSISSKGSTSSDSDSDSSISSDSSSSSSDENISNISSSGSSSESSDSSDSTDSTDSSSESSDSEDEDEERKITVNGLKVNPPGLGSLRTKKSNQRNKLRRRLSKLKEFGVLPEQADFSALREWEEKNGDWKFDGSALAKPLADEKRNAKEQEQAEFEAKRQKLLRDLAAGGVDVGAFTEKGNAPSAQGVEERQGQVSEEDREQAEFNAKRQKLLRDLEAGGVNVDAVTEKEHEQEQPKDDTTMEDVQAEPAKRRSLDVASSRRLLFGSLGVKTLKSKEEEEATRKKLAGKVNNFQSQRPVEAEQPDESEDDKDENWEDKLIIRATECVFDDIELTAPPFPFEQRWDEKAHEIIRQRKGWGKKRKRKDRIQVYDGGGEEYGYEEGYDGYDGYEDGYDGNWDYENGEMQLEYDDVEQEQPNGVEADGIEHEQTAPEKSENVEEGDLPELPEDISTIPDLTEDDLKKNSVIAFKQLDMSKDTNWQPRVSDYRVAEIHEIFEEDNILKLRLAKRHRRQPKANNDEEDDEDEGPRMYSGFEMPGFEDDEDDDGFREMSFADFIEPKLLRAGGGAGQGDGDGDNDMSMN